MAILCVYYLLHAYSSAYMIGHLVSRSWSLRTEFERGMGLLVLQ